MKADTIIGAVQGVTKKWAKQRKREEREASARAEPALRDDATPLRHASARPPARVMEQAYLKASANGTPAGARPADHVRRAAVHPAARRPASSASDSISTSRRRCCPTTSRRTASTGTSSTTPAATSPSRTPEHEVPLGTLQVRDYLARSGSTRSAIPSSTSAEKLYPTFGPRAPLRRDPVHREGRLHAAVRGGAARRALRPRDHVDQGHDGHRQPAAGRRAVRRHASRCSSCTTSTSRLLDRRHAAARHPPLRLLTGLRGDRPRPAARGHRRARDEEVDHIWRDEAVAGTCEKNGATAEEIEFLHTAGRAERASPAPTSSRGSSESSTSTGSRRSCRTRRPCAKRAGVPAPPGS